GAAGQRAFARDDAPAAVNLLDRALALATNENPAQLELLRQLSTSLWSIGEVARAEALLSGLIEAATATGDRRYELYGALQQLSWRFSRDEATWEEVSSVAGEALTAFQEAGDDFGLAQAWRQLASTLHSRSRFAEAAEACERALEHARRACKHDACRGAHEPWIAREPDGRARRAQGDAKVVRRRAGAPRGSPAHVRATGAAARV